jgi:four helix bundle protein
MAQFQLEDLNPWPKPVDTGNRPHETANELDEENTFRFVEQLKGKALPISNNTAEDSAGSDEQFKRYLSIGPGSVYENVNMIKVFSSREYLVKALTTNVLKEINQFPWKITSFRIGLS